jgi:uncharacterized protein (UPF0335 family)
MAGLDAIARMADFEVIRLRKQDQKERDEQESLLDAYMQALKGEPRAAKAA